MPETEHQRVVVEHLSWRQVFHFALLFRAFQMAIQPPKLVLAFVLVVMLFLVGWGLDTVWPSRALPGEVHDYAAMSDRDAFELYRERNLALNDAAANPDTPDTPRAASPDRHLPGPFEAAWQFKRQALMQILAGAMDLDFGTHVILTGRIATNRATVLDGVGNLAYTLPSWLVRYHPWFLAIYGLIAWLLWVLFAGVITRIAALEATQDRPASPVRSFDYVRERWPVFMFAPLLPALLVVLMVGFLALMGLVFFNLPVLNVIGGIVFGVALLVGLVLTIILALTILAGPMFYPAIAIDSHDVFDTISSTFSYVVGRPWHYVFYSAISLLYGCACFLVVAGVIALTFTLVAGALDIGVFVEDGSAAIEVLEGDAITDRGVDWDRYENEGSEQATAGLVRAWQLLFGAIPLAFAVSFFLCAWTLIYLLLRRANDGTEVDELYVDPVATMERQAREAAQQPPPPAAT